MKKIAALFLSAFLIVIIYAETASAIPAFARKYSMTCQTCHSPTPRLKDYGDDFAGNGFQLSDKEAPRYYQETGDPILSLIRDFPIAVRFDGFISYNNGNSDISDVQTPYLMKLMSGGAITDDIAYYFYFYLSEHGEIAGIEDAYIMFNDIFDIDFDIYLGQFQVSDPLFKRELRLTLEDYHVYTATPGQSNINLKYDKGIMMTFGFDTGTDIIFEILNGNGIGETNSQGNFDKDKYKNFAGRISQSIGDFLRIGAFGYYGKEINQAPAGGEFENRMWLAGPDITLALGDMLELNGQYITRNDGTMYMAGSEVKDSKTDAALAELIITPMGDESRIYGVAMYNWIDSDFDALDYQSVTGHIGYLLRRNLRLVAEYTQNMTDEYGKFSVGFVSAF
ncbi:MAG: hypothetical protein ACLFQX_02885 [Candidatus Kapaibacterium sp.]